MKQVITWLGKPVKLIGPAGNALPRLGGTRGRFWLFSLADGSRDDIDGFAQEKDLFVTVVPDEWTYFAPPTIEED